MEGRKKRGGGGCCKRQRGLAGGRSTGCTLGYTLRALAGFSRRYIPCRGHRPGPTNPPTLPALAACTQPHTHTDEWRARKFAFGCHPEINVLAFDGLTVEKRQLV